MKSDRPRSARSLTKAELIEENEQLRERLARAEGPGRETSGIEEAERLRRELAEALEQQTATSDILRVISSSPTDIQPVLEAVAATAARVCGATDAVIRRVEGSDMRRVAHFGPIPLVLPEVRRITEGSVAGRAILECLAIHVHDVLESDAARDYPDDGSRGWRTYLAVPLLHEGVAIGAIVIRRTEVRPFTEKQIKLLETFAAQAVIAIENVRLFTELQSRNRDLTTALDRQTATADVLRIIAQSPTELQPVLDTIATSAVRLCAASDAVIERLEGARFYNAAHAGSQMKGLVGLPLPLTRQFPGGRAILDRRPIIIDDIHAVAEREYPDTLELLKLNTIRSVAEIPLLSEGKPLGSLAVLRAEVRPFTNAEVALLRTFADQAVIAIENVRLFKELEARNRDLTAASEILQVISRSPTDVQPVFDTIVESAVTLCDGLFGGLVRFDGELIYVVATHNYSPEALDTLRRVFPARPSRTLGVGRAILERDVVHLPDVELDPEYQVQNLAGAIGFRSGLFVPMLRDGAPIGAILVARATPGAFSDNQIALLKTFADQAVIAIENVRLFTELQEKNRALTQAHAQVTEALEQQTATSEILRVISGSPTDVEPVFRTILANANTLCDARFSVLWLWDGEALAARAHVNVSPRMAEHLLTARPRTNRGTPLGLCLLEQAVVHVPDILTDPRFAPEDVPTYRLDGARSTMNVPMVREGGLVGVINIWRREPRAFTDAQIDLLKTFADQAVIAIENVRLFNELEVANRALKAASQHKSEFLANMSHELRTPLNAIIGFSEVLTERMFGDLNEKQDEYLKDIYASGTHLLSLINDILDLSKIEAGRMELELTDFDLPQAIDNALTLVRERAGRRGIALHQSVEAHLGEIKGDERKVKQVLLNLLSNALKFTPEGGRVEVRARVVDGMAEISVTDTGVGIAAEDQEAVFEEFRQVGTTEKKAEGTGLGLTLCRKFVELHGGRIWVTSQVGSGSTFTFTIPVCRAE